MGTIKQNLQLRLLPKESAFKKHNEVNTNCQTHQFIQTALLKIEGLTPCLSSSMLGLKKQCTAPKSRLLYGLCARAPCDHHL
jgi:hypothetical protein